MGRFRFLTAGESHGRGLTAVVEGMVAGLPLDEAHINGQLKRRQHGYGRGPRMSIEEDRAEIISGVRYGRTTGSSISLFIRNRDWENWRQQMSVASVDEEAEPVMRPRPGHADLAGLTKYGLQDIRPIIERASARETAARVAVGAVAGRFLEELGIAIHSHTVGIGNVGGSSRLCQDKPCDEMAADWDRVESSPVRCADAALEGAMMAAIDDAKAGRDTLGGVVEVIATGVPVGLGSHVSWDRRLDGRIARAIMSINAVKGVEIGAGFALAQVRGAQAHDVIEPAAGGPLPWRRATNRAGGIEGGMSNGESIEIRAAVKPVATLAGSLPSMDLRTGEATEAHYERSDICVVPAVGVIAEAMLCIVLADACLEKFGGDNLEETLANHRNYMNSIAR